MVSNQERRAPVVLRIYSGSTAGFVPPPVYIGIRLCVLPETRPVGFCLAGKRDGFILGERTSRRSVLPVPAPPRRAPPRPNPPVVCPGFGLDRFFYILAALIDDERRIYL